jgi:hypothetical protein
MYLIFIHRHNYTKNFLHAFRGHLYIQAVLKKTAHIDNCLKKRTLTYLLY